MIPESFALFYLPLSTGEAQLVVRRTGDLPIATDTGGLCHLSSRLLRLS